MEDGNQTRLMVVMEGDSLTGVNGGDGGVGFVFSFFFIFLYFTFTLSIYIFREISYGSIQFIILVEYICISA